MPENNTSREEGLVVLLYNYVLSRGIVLVLNWENLVGTLIWRFGKLSEHRQI